MSIRTAIVDSDPATRTLIASLLRESLHCDLVFEFAEAHPALEAFPVLSADLMLIDSGLYDMSWTGLIRELRACCRESKIFALTVLGDEKTVVAALESGADGYLLKGTPQEELKRVICALPEAGSPLSPMIARKLLSRFRVQSENASRQSDTTGELAALEQQILGMIAKGFSYTETSKTCGISIKALNSILNTIFRKLRFRSAPTCQRP